MAKELKNLLGDIFDQQTHWRYQLLQAWPSIIGTLATRVTLEKIQDDTLVIGVYDSCWLQELYMLSPMLLSLINKKLERPYIKQVRFKKAGMPTAQTHKTIKKKMRPIVHHTLTYGEQAALTKIDDEQLKSALHDFLNRCYQEKL